MNVVVPAALAGARVDRTVAELLDVSVGAARRLCEAGRVRVDGKRAKKGDAVRAGDNVVVEGGGAWLVPAAELARAVPVLFADDGVLVVDKPAGMACHPLVPGEGGTVVDALAAAHPEIASASEDPREGGLVHRLDTGTSGCLAVARTRAAWSELRAAFSAPAGEDGVDKRYLAVVEGVVRAPFVVDGAVAHDPADPRRMCVEPPDAAGAREARTEVEPLEAGPAHSLVAVRLVGAGRRHQIRVHLATAGHPLAGDALYGAAAADFAWHLLHAASLALPGRAPVRAGPPPAFVEAARTRGLRVPGGGI